MQKQKMFIKTSNHFIYVLTAYIRSTCKLRKTENSQDQLLPIYIKTFAIH